MNPGKLDQRIIVEQRRVESKDGFGAKKEDWIEVFKAWAGVTRIGSRERLQSNTKLAVEVATFEIRWRNGFVPGAGSHRIRFEKKGNTEVLRIWDITGIKHLPRKRGWELTAEARVD